jgi:hypothetical protein
MAELIIAYISVLRKGINKPVKQTLLSEHNMMLLLYIYVVVNYSGIALYGLLIYKCTNIYVIGFWDYKLWQIVYGGVHG